MLINGCEMTHSLEEMPQDLEAVAELQKAHGTGRGP